MTTFVTPRAAFLPPILLWIAAICCALVAKGQDESPPAAPKPPPPVVFSWDLTPYDVLVWIHADRAASLPEVTTSAWQNLLAEKVSAALGPGCKVRVTAMPDVARREFRASLAELTPAALAPAIAKPIPDKIFLVACMTGVDVPSLEIRELDLRTWSLGPIARRELPHRSIIGEEITSGISEAFRPLGRVESAKDNGAAILPRAGGLLIGDRSRGELKSGDILRVYVRRADRFGEAKPQDVGPIHWTYVTAGAPNGRFVDSQVLSALRQPLTGRFGSRVEKLVLSVRPQAAETTLHLKSRQPPHPSLAGYEIFDLQPNQQPMPLGFTDGDGRLSIPPRATGIYRLHVRHGREVLARLPLVPGTEKEVTAFLADDGPRLDAEGFLSGVQETLIDTVARRQVAFARIERLIGKGDIAGAAREMEYLRLLPTRAQLAAQLSNQQAKYASGELPVQKKIDKLFTDTRQLLEKYLDPQEIEVQAAKIEQARRGNAEGQPPVALPEPAAPKPVAPFAPMPGVPANPIPGFPPMPGVPMPGSGPAPPPFPGSTVK